MRLGSLLHETEIPVGQVFLCSKFDGDEINVSSAPADVLKDHIPHDLSLALDLESPLAYSNFTLSSNPQ